MTNELIVNLATCMSVDMIADCIRNSIFKPDTTCVFHRTLMKAFNYKVTQLFDYPGMKAYRQSVRNYVDVETYTHRDRVNMYKDMIKLAKDAVSCEERIMHFYALQGDVVGYTEAYDYAREIDILTITFEGELDRARNELHEARMRAKKDAKVSVERPQPTHDYYCTNGLTTVVDADGVTWDTEGNE